METIQTQQMPITPERSRFSPLPSLRPQPITSTDDHVEKAKLRATSEEDRTSNEIGMTLRLLGTFPQRKDRVFVSLEPIATWCLIMTFAACVTSVVTSLKSIRMSRVQACSFSRRPSWHVRYYLHLKCHFMRTTCACLGTPQRTAKLQLPTASTASAATKAGFILLRGKKSTARQPLDKLERINQRMPPVNLID